MNQFTVKSIDETNSDQFDALLLGALLAPDFQVSMYSSEVSTGQLVPLINFSLDFSLDNYGVVFTAEWKNDASMRFFQTVKDSRLTGVKSLAFKPYAIKGYKVAFLQEVESSISPILVDMEKDYISFPITRSDASGEKKCRFVIGTVSASQTETYKPFQSGTLTTGKVSQIRFFSENDADEVIKQNACGVVKPIIADNVARKTL